MDLSFASRQDQWRYDWTPLWDDPLLAILPPDYPAGGRDRFPVAEFAGKEFLMPSLGFDLDIVGVFDAQNIRPDIRSNTAVEDAAILSMVEHGLGVSILSQLVLQGRRDNVRALPLDPPACRHIGVAVRSMEEALPVVREFIAYSRASSPPSTARRNKACYRSWAIIANGKIKSKNPAKRGERSRSGPLPFVSFVLRNALRYACASLSTSAYQ